MRTYERKQQNKRSMTNVPSSSYIRRYSMEVNMKIKFTEIYDIIWRFGYIIMGNQSIVAKMKMPSNHDFQLCSWGVTTKTLKRAFPNKTKLRLVRMGMLLHRQSYVYNWTNKSATALLARMNFSLILHNRSPKTVWIYGHYFRSLDQIARRWNLRCICSPAKVCVV